MWVIRDVNNKRKEGKDKDGVWVARGGAEAGQCLEFWMIG